MNRLKKIVRTIAFVFCSFARSVVNGGWIQKNENPDLSLDKSAQWGIKSVAYTQNDGTNTYYTSIEAALKRTSSGTVYVIPGTNPTISHNCEIKSGVTLALPYEDDLKEKHVLEDSARTGTGDFADKKPDTYRKSQVTIADEITLTNNGTLFVGGVLGRNGQAPTGRTIGDYSEISLGRNAHITNSGQLTCYGYIKEKTAKNGSSVASINSGKMDLPFVIYDYRGGSYTYYSVNYFDKLNVRGWKACPFNVFDLPNIQGTVSLSGESELTGIATIHTDSPDKIYPLAPMIVGPKDSSALIKLGSGTISYYYDAPLGYSYDDFDSGTRKDLINKTSFYVNGDVTISSMNMNIGISIDTKDFHLPFSYKFDFEFESGTATISNKIKFLSGLNTHISKKAKVQIDAETVFYQDFVPARQYDRKYPDSLGSATLINDGTLEINSSFGGAVNTNAETGNIVTKSGFSSSVETTEATYGSKGGFDGTKVGHTETAKITLVDTQKYVSGSDREREYVAPSSLNSSVLEKNKTYTSGKRSDNGYGWYSGSVKHIYGIRYVSNSSTATNPSDNPTSFNDGDSNDIVINDRSNQEAGKTFGGYYYDSELTKPLDKNNDKKCVLKAGTAVNYLNGLNHITLYAKWTDKLFDVTLEYRKEGGVVGTKSYSISSADTSFVLTNPSDRKTSYETNVSADAKTVNTFTGWKISGDDSNVYPSQTDVLSKLKELHNQGVKELKITSIIQSVNYLRVQVNNTKFGVVFGIGGSDVIRTAKTENGTDLLNSKTFVSVSDVLTIVVEGSGRHSRAFKLEIKGYDAKTYSFGATSSKDHKTTTIKCSDYPEAFNNLEGPITITASSS